MNYEEAKRILDQVSEGRPHAEDRIIYALYLTGDIELHAGLRGQGVDAEIPPESFHAWRRERTSMVGRGQA